MTQLDMFKDVVKNGKRELSYYDEMTIQMDFADEYITRKQFGKLIDNQWVYVKDEYKLLHYLARHGLGMKNSIQGYELSNVILNTQNTEKLRSMVNTLRNDPLNELIVGSSQNGYFIAKSDEIYDAVRYIFSKSVNEMITAINMYPPLFERYIKIAQRTYQDNDRVFDSQLTAQFDELTDEMINEIVIRYADTMKYEGKRNADK